MKYAEPRREHATQFQLECSPLKLLDRSYQNFTRYSGISGAIASCIIQRDRAFRFRTPEKRVKVVDFDVGQNAPKLIAFHSNVP